VKQKQKQNEVKIESNHWWKSVVSLLTKLPLSPRRARRNWIIREDADYPQLDESATS